MPAILSNILKSRKSLFASRKSLTNALKLRMDIMDMDSNLKKMGHFQIYSNVVSLGAFDAYYGNNTGKSIG